MNRYEDIDITGKCNPDLLDFKLEENPYWTQISIPENLTIPNQKPDIEEINSLNIHVEIIRKKVVSSPRSGGKSPNAQQENYEGKILTGRKLIIEGLLCETISYIAATEEQSMNSAQFSIPFSAFIIVPDKIDGVDTKDINFKIDTCIEDVFIKQVCKRDIFKNVTILITAIPIPGEECNEEFDEGCKKDGCLCNIECDLTNYKGICDNKKIEEMLLADELEWTEFYIPEVLIIPCTKPEIESLMSVTTNVDIISQRVVRTPRFEVAGTIVENNEGLALTGRKLIIEGVLRQKVIYTAAKKDQSVHAAHFDIPFSVFIVIKEETPLNEKYKIDTCIEDVFACIIGCKQIFKNVTLFIKATPIESCN